MRKHSQINIDNQICVIYKHLNSLHLEMCLWVDTEKMPENYRREYAKQNNLFEKKIKNDWKNDEYFLQSQNFMSIIDFSDENEIYDKIKKPRIKINYSLLLYVNDEEKKINEQKLEEMIEYIFSSDLFKFHQQFKYVKN